MRHLLGGGFGAVGLKQSQNPHGVASPLDGKMRVTSKSLRVPTPGLAAGRGLVGAWEGEGTASPKIGLVKKLYKLDLALHQIAHNNTWALDY